MRVVVAVDHSKTANHAAEYTLQLVGGDHGRGDGLVDKAYLYSASKDHGVHPATNDSITDLTAHFAAKLGVHNVHAEIQSETDPKSGIIEYSEEVDADMVVMGMRGLGKIERVLVGSVSSYVVHHSDMPVMVVPKQVAGGDHLYMCCVDGSAATPHVAKFMAKMVRPGDTVVLFHSFELPPMMVRKGLGWSGTQRAAKPEAAHHFLERNPKYEEEKQKAKAEASRTINFVKSILNEVKDKEGNPIDILVEDHVVSTHDPRQAAIEFAEYHQVKTIVCGTKGHGKLSRMVLGSFSNYLLHHTDHQALVVVPIPTHEHGVKADNPNEDDDPNAEILAAGREHEEGEATL